MAKITNPEKQCETAPKSFSGESKIERVDMEDYRRGIILDSIEEFGQALAVYNGSSVQGARATQNNLMDAVGDRGGGMGAAILSLSGAMNADGFTERLVKEATSSLKSNGRFYKDFDYDAIGTNFFKTTVRGEKVGDKYILELSAAYVGTKPEEKLAETIGKPRALVCSRAKGRISVVDDWWFNLNLEDSVKGLPLPKKSLNDASQWAQYFASGGYAGKAPEFEFNYKKNKFGLTISLEADKYLRPEGGEHGSEYMQARGKSIVGGAWTTWAENGNDKVEPRIVQPSLVYSVYLPGERYSRQAALAPEEINAVQSARDYIAGLIQQKV
jgi:hypothetical protein